VTSRYLSAPNPAPELIAGFEAIRTELDVPRGFGPDALQDARAAAHARVTAVDATGIPFVTIDPATSMDLDQAVHIERVGPGYRVHYAIADVPSFVQPESALATEVWARAMTLYSPDQKTPLHPEILSENAASLLPAQTRSALVWEIDLDAQAGTRRARVYRARVRSRAKLSYEAVQEALDGGIAEESLGLLREVGLLLQSRERARGGVSLPGAEQEVVTDGTTYALVLREPLRVEGWNAQVSLLTGRAAAQMMIEGGIGVLRTMPAATPADVGRVRAVARSLGIEWPKAEPYADAIARMDPQRPTEAALLNAAPTLLRGAGYTPFDGVLPELTTHSAVAAPYAHVTAPLRRLVDRWGLQVCLSLCEGTDVPAWVRETLFDLPEAMRTGSRRARALERANVDLVEAFVLRDRVGEEFEAVVLDTRADTSLVQLREPAVIARAQGALPLGERTVVRLQEADVNRRFVTFVPADQPPNLV
jgi:exoribonuclease R